MTCTACAKAAADPRSGEFMLGCNECRTRQLAHGLWFFGPGIQPDLYRAALARVTREGEEPKDAHARVVAWAERIKSVREAVARKPQDNA